MSKSTQKSAAVPFVNAKGERSMKRVKVERYFAGKKPAYAKDDDEESIYSSDEEKACGDEEQCSEYSSEEESCDGDKDVIKQEKTEEMKHESGDTSDSADDADEDPRFRRLRFARTSTIIPKHGIQNDRKIVIEDEEYDDDDEDAVRQRHALARRRRIDEIVSHTYSEKTHDSGAKTLDDSVRDDNNDDEDDGLFNLQRDRSNRLDTDDLLKDFKLTGFGSAINEIGPIKSAEERSVDERKLKDALEQAKQEAKFTQQLNKKIEDDIKRELEREALAKGDIGAREMTAVNTDDEDDEIAYEAWKLREIKRVLRDQSERKLESRDRMSVRAR